MSSPTAANGGGGVFVQDLNPMTGKCEWQVMSEDYDYQQEVARAGFADMLHDSERNRLYYDGLRSAVRLLRSKGEPVHVLDIGTGTGLLSMMAAALGADSVTAVEEFKPMAACAKEVMALNGFADKIRLIRKRSTEVEVGEGKDMRRRANLLVTEVFDTELIGEGAVGTYNHAHKHLLTPDCLVVPTSGRMYAQVVKSDLASRWSSLKPIADPESSSSVLLEDKNASSSSSSLALHDLQLTEFQPEWFHPVTGPLKVFDFDFSGRSGPIPEREQTVATCPEAESGGKCDAVFVWWDLWMDPERKVLLSCAPKWAHPKPKDMAWRDHWMQAVYYPLSSVEAEKGRPLSVVSNHDEYSLWFDVTAKDNPADIPQIPMPSPSPSLHLAVSRPRLGQINCRERNAALVKVVRRLASEGAKSFFCLGELSLLPLLAAASVPGATAVAAEKNTQMRSALLRLAEENGLADRVRILDCAPEEMASLEDLPFAAEATVGEPNFALSLLPWHNLRFWFCLDRLRKKIGPGGDSSGDLKISPLSAEIWAAPVEYRDLWKIRAPLGEVEGFKMEPFDNIIMDACDACDAEVEPHPLWEYPCTARGEPRRLMAFDFSSSLPDKAQEETTVLSLEGGEKVNGVALWMVWQLDQETSLCTGPVEQVKVGQMIEWDVHSKQGVHLLANRKRDLARIIEGVEVKTRFDSQEGDVDFKFRVVKK